MACFLFFDCARQFVLQDTNPENTFGRVPPTKKQTEQRETGPINRTPLKPSNPNKLNKPNKPNKPNTPNKQSKPNQPSHAKLWQTPCKTRRNDPPTCFPGGNVARLLEQLLQLLRPGAWPKFPGSPQRSRRRAGSILGAQEARCQCGENGRAVGGASFHYEGS